MNTIGHRMQSGGLNIIEVLILIGLAGIAAMLIFGESPRIWRDACIKSGGVPVYIDHNRICYAKSVVIEVPMQ